MSRIHEALKKAEQERAMGQSRAGIEPSAYEAPLDAESVIATASALGAAPGAPSNQQSLLARSRQTHWAPDSKSMLFFGDQEHASGMEEFRTLRNRLYQIREKQPLSKLLISSALPQEGKSFTSVNLASVIVRQHGRRALLIDGDLRNPSLHSLLGAESGPGLSEYLREGGDEFSIIQSGPMENLFFIPAGGNAGNSSELLANGRIKVLLSRLERMFDWIIVDSPPAALVSDAGLLANNCDGILLVVRSNNTPAEAVRKAISGFNNQPVVGVVLNGITADLAPYSQYYYPSYGTEAKAAAKN